MHSNIDFAKYTVIVGVILDFKLLNTRKCIIYVNLISNDLGKFYSTELQALCSISTEFTLPYSMKMNNNST